MNSQKERLWIIPVILIAWLPYLMGAWDKTLPGDNSAWNDAAGEIRANMAVLESAIGAEHDFNASTQTGVHTTINATGDATISGGAVNIGADGTEEGILTLYRKDTNEFAYICLYSSDGTPYYFFVHNDGDLRVHTSAPTAITDGSVVGSQS